ncbi:MAG TPA: isoamylase early set domain-containing protein [Gemmatimonadales bacterium]|nr:isoamylase early set domain-containing protein [Gemmatimonadales bacterium]
MNPIDPRVHQALDGEISPDSLPPELRRQVERLEGAAALLARVPELGVERRVMASISRPAPTRVRRLTRWLVTPHSLVLRVRPLWSVALAAVAVLFAIIPVRETGPRLGQEEGIAQFVARFPGAQSVAVVGSFNDWAEGSIPMEDQDHDGVWRASVVLPAGTHEYMFVVDGERWVADPLAGRYVEDDFGRENSLLIVRPAHR